MYLYVRLLTEKEGEKVHYLLIRGKARTAIRRAQVIALSAQGMRVGEISRSVHLTVDNSLWVVESVREPSFCV